jgi:serine/threonine protein kinase
MHGKKIDIWAAGVTLYFLVFGKHPFNDHLKGHTNFFNAVLENKIEYPTLDDA